MIDEQIQIRKGRFQTYKQTKDTDNVWKHWSKAVEEGCLNYLQLNKTVWMM